MEGVREQRSRSGLMKLRLVALLAVAEVGAARRSCLKQRTTCRSPSTGVVAEGSR